MTENGIAREVVDAALEVHRCIGPGLLESVYQRFLVHEPALRNLYLETEVPIAVDYKGLKIDVAYRMDLLVDRRVIVELKASEAVNASHRAQLLSYLRLTGLKLGLLINFSTPLLREGITRLVNGL